MATGALIAGYAAEAAGGTRETSELLIVPVSGYIAGWSSGRVGVGIGGRNDAFSEYLEVPLFAFAYAVLPDRIGFRVAPIA